MSGQFPCWPRSGSRDPVPTMFAGAKVVHHTGAMPMRITNFPVRWTLALIVLAAGVLPACYVYIGADGATGAGFLDITQQPRSQTVTAGARATFSIGIAGTGTLTFQWHRNGVAIAGANGVSYTTPPTVLAD